MVVVLKKILILGGSYIQIPAIKMAKRMGYYVITCDFKQNNPGHKIANEYYNVSFTDKEAVLALAKELEIDAVIAYTSEHATSTAAYVAEKLGLPTNPYKSIDLLSNKDKYRSFLAENGFNVPRARGYQSVEDALSEFHEFTLPVIVKPVDSSGSRGISKLDSVEQLPIKAEYALSFSMAKRFIIEEYIEQSGYMIVGDGFFVDGNLIFSSFANGHLNNKLINPFVPTGVSMPCSYSERIKKKIKEEVERVWGLLDMKTGPVSFDIFVDKNEDVYLNELPARHDGYLVPQLTEYSTGVNLIEYTIKAAFGEDCSGITMHEAEGYWASYMVHSNKAGILAGVKIEDEIKNNLSEFHWLVNIGDEISPFTGTDKALGIMVLNFKNRGEMEYKMNNMAKFLEVIIE